jgi:O-antigen/teichoic acid export membrane protein
MSLKEFAARVFSLPYELIFQEELSRDAAMLLKSSSRVATGVLVGSLLTLVFNILSARILGPSDFGNLGLILTIGNIFGLTMGFAVYPMIVYASRASTEAEQTTVISTAYVLITLLTVASVTLYVLISGLLSQVFRISATLLLFSIAYATIYSFFVVTINPLRIFSKMKTYALLNTLQSIIMLGVFLAFISYDVKSWETATYSLYASYALVGLISIVFLRKYITLRFDRAWSKKIMTYFLVSMPGAVAGVCLGIDRILINIFRSTEQVGIYNAYFVPSMTVALLLWGIFGAAFFPYASRSHDKGALFVKITKATPYVSIALVPVFVLLERLAFFLYGSQYPFSWVIAFFFGLAATASFFLSGYSALMMSEGARGARVTSDSSIVTLIALVILDVALIPVIGILGAAITLVVANVSAVCYLALRRRTLGGSLTDPQTLSDGSLNQKQSD